LSSENVEIVRPLYGALTRMGAAEDLVAWREAIAM
jgi:hypothetical protein